MFNKKIFNKLNIFNDFFFYKKNNRYTKQEEEEEANLVTNIYHQFFLSLNHFVVFQLQHPIK